MMEKPEVTEAPLWLVEELDHALRAVLNDAAVLSWHPLTLKEAHDALAHASQWLMGVKR